MMDATLFRAKHQLWLRIAFMSFSVKDDNLNRRLYEFFQIEYGHLKWVAGSLYENSVGYD